MKKKIKLKDLSQKENVKWCEKNCVFYGNDWNCNECIFYSVMCAADKQKNWIYHKDLYSDKFLDQEIEIEVPDILTKEEKEYLSAVIKPFRDRIISIEKHEQDLYYQTIIIQLTSKYPNKDFEFIRLPWFNEAEKIYKNMEARKKYDLEELGL